jgi:hypothetical protein
VETLSRATGDAVKNRTVRRRRQRLEEGDEPNPRRPRVLDRESSAFLFVQGKLGDALRSLNAFTEEWSAQPEEVRQSQDLIDAADETFDRLEFALQAARAAVHGASDEDLAALLRGTE